MGGQRIARNGLGRSECGGSGHGYVARHDHCGDARTRIALRQARGGSDAGSSSRGGSEPARGRRREVDGDSECVGGTVDARRSGIPLALDVQEYAATGRGIDPSGPPRESQHGGSTVARRRVQFAGESEDAGRRIAPGPQRAVPAHQSTSETVPPTWSCSLSARRWDRERRDERGRVYPAVRARASIASNISTARIGLEM